MKLIHLVMIRDNLLNIPSYPPPEGFTLRTYNDGDTDLWTRIEASVDEFPNPTGAREHFEREFGSRLKQFMLSMSAPTLQHADELLLAVAD